jgi:Photosynthesis system II assembly factor YCF48
VLRWCTCFQLVVAGRGPGTPCGQARSESTTVSCARGRRPGNLRGHRLPAALPFTRWISESSSIRQAIRRRGRAVRCAARPPGGFSEPQMELSVTTDGGARWLTSPVGSPNRLFADTEFTPAYVDFVDARHGWVVAMIATVSGVAAWRILLHTSDGGASCQRLPFPGRRAGGIRQPDDGMAHPDAEPGTVDAGKIYVTHDSGRTWHAQTVALPAGYRRRTSASRYRRSPGQPA